MVTAQGAGYPVPIVNPTPQTPNPQTPNPNPQTLHQATDVYIVNPNQATNHAYMPPVNLKPHPKPDNPKS